MTSQMLLDAAVLQAAPHLRSLGLGSSWSRGAASQIHWASMSVCWSAGAAGTVGNARDSQTLVCAA
jgi:hypothetical protein